LRKTGLLTHLIANGVVLYNKGTIEVNQGNLSFELNGVLDNHGAVEVKAGNLYFTFGGTFATNAGSVFVAPGATLHGNIVNGSTGLLQGAGTVRGAVTLETGGEIKAGVSETATTMTLTNGLTMADGSDYAVTLFGTDPSAISMVAVTGDADIAMEANLRLDLSKLSPVDVAALRAEIGEGTSRSYAVLTADTISGGGFGAANFTISDYGSFLTSEWKLETLTSANTVEITITPVTGLAADFDEDGDVDADDLASWNAGFGVATGASHMQGDADANGSVDGGDFLDWQRQLGGNPAVAATMTAPEPSTALPFVLALLTCGSPRVQARRARSVVVDKRVAPAC
jgi:hypothetical protein